MENTAAVDAMEAFEASVAALADCMRRVRGDSGSADPLRDQADACLDGLAESARAEAMMAAVRVHLAAAYAEKAPALASPAATPQENTAQEMAVVAEVACVLTVSERTAGALLSESHELTTALPLTLAAPGPFRGSTPGSWSMKRPTWTLQAPPHSKPTSWTPTP
jgi:hypothetical protein